MKMHVRRTSSNWQLLAGITLLFASGCGTSSQPGANEGAASSPSTAAASAETSQASPPVAPTSAPSASAAATPVATKPTATAAKAASPAAPPASLRTALETINLAQLPAPPGAEYQERDVQSIMLTVPLKLSAAYEFYTAALAKRGWREENGGNERQVTDQYAQTALTKDGFLLSLYVSPNGDKADSAQVMLRNHGNVDTRKLPAPAGSKQLYGSVGSTIYNTTANVAEAAQACRAALTQAGWLEFGPAFAARAENDENEFLTFRNGGIELNVMVGKAPAQGDQTSVHYSVTLLGGELPWPTDAQQVEFDDGRMYLAFQSPQSIEQLVGFYEQQLAEMAWSGRAEFKQVNDKSASLYFDDADKNRLIVHIDANRDEGARHVKIERVTAAELEAIAERAKRNEDSLLKPGETSSGDDPAAAPPVAKSQIAARELKLPATAKRPAYASDAGEITFTTKDLPTAVAEFFRDQLLGETWKEDQRFSVVSDDAAVFEFKGAGDARLSFTLVRFPDADGTRVTISGDGLAWGAQAAGEASAESTADVAADIPATTENADSADTPEPMPGDEELTAEDKDGYPVPSGYTSYSKESTPFRQTINVSKSAPLDKLVEFFRRELPARGWKEETKGASVAAEQATLQFAGDAGPLSIKLKRANDETQVELFTRSTAAAKQAGILPKAGQARLIFGNSLKSEITLKVAGQTIKLRPGEGEKKPDGPSLDLAPGTYEITTTIAGKPSAEKVTVEADQTWGVIVLDLGVLPLLMY